MEPVPDLDRYPEGAREVVTAVHLPVAATDRLQASLGDRFRVVDIKDSSPSADIVLCPPCSPQTIGALRSQFPEAEIVVTELQDAELAVSVGGPITRTLDAGAASYLVVRSVKDLAAMLGEREKSGPLFQEVKALAAATVDDEILRALADLSQRRAAAPHPPDEK